MNKITGSPYYVSVAHVTETMTLSNTILSETLDCNVVVEESILVIDSGIQLTIDQGKTLIPNVYG